MLRNLLRRVQGAALTLLLVAGLNAAPDRAEAQDFWIGQIVMGGWNFCPRNTIAANGQLLPISSNTALFSLYGTMYGGDGRTTFALPDLRGRFPMGVGHGPGLSPRSYGEKAGVEEHTLTIPEIPSHNHLVQAVRSAGDAGGPGNDLLAIPSTNISSDPNDHIFIYDKDNAPNATMDPRMITNTGGSLPHNVMNPFQVIQFCVVQFGIFPSRN